MQGQDQCLAAVIGPHSELPREFMPLLIPFLCVNVQELTRPEDVNHPELVAHLHVDVGCIFVPRQYELCVTFYHEEDIAYRLVLHEDVLIFSIEFWLQKGTHPQDK